MLVKTEEEEQQQEENENVVDLTMNLGKNGSGLETPKAIQLMGFEMPNFSVDNNRFVWVKHLKLLYGTITKG